MSATTQSSLIPPRRPASGNLTDGGSGREPVLRFGKVSMAGSATDDSFEWLLKRNCSMAPRQLAAVYTSLCIISLGVAAFFWSRGATLVMPFAWAELVGLGLALFIYARHAADFEHIDLSRGRLTVEHCSGNRLERVEFEPAWVRVEPRDDDRSLIELSGQGKHIAVGRFVRPELRRQLAEELRLALRGWPRPGWRQAL
jgi:uncharacterized membrane protein